jgi:hypothetical protein
MDLRHRHKDRPWKNAIFVTAGWEKGTHEINSMAILLLIKNYYLKGLRRLE